MCMKKIILILFISTFSTACFAQGQFLFQPQQTDNLWYAWADYIGRNTEILIDHWDGSNWSKIEKLTDNSANALSPAVALDNKNNPWVVWTGYDGISTSIYCRHYDGRSWSETRQVDSVDIYWDSNPAITFDKNNTPWVTWVGSDGKDDDIYVSYWNGKSWAQPAMVNSDDFTPDVMPVIFTDENKNLIVVWCGFEVDRYKLFYSKRLNNKWTEEKPVVQNLARAGADHPNILKKPDGEIELIWNEQNLGYKSHWDGSSWSNPESIEILLPKDFFQKLSVGSSYVSWEQDNICQSFRVMPAVQKAQKVLTAYLRHNSAEYSSWFSSFLCPTANAEVEENKYIAFGDSITAGIGATTTSDGVLNGYPPRLEKMLNEKIAPSIVVNEGNPGEYTPGGAERIDDVLNKNNAKYILIMEGTNDVTHNDSTETIIFFLGLIVEHSQNYGTTPLLAGLTPRMDFLNERVSDDINPAIKILAEEKGVTYVDQYTEFAKDKALYMSDGRLHPNDAGYQLMAETWFASIDNIINPGKKDKNKDSGCGVVPPIYRNGSNNGIFNNLLPLAVLTILLFFLRKLAF